MQVSPFGEWNKLKIYSCIVFTGFKQENVIFLKVSAGGLILTYRKIPKIKALFEVWKCSGKSRYPGAFPAVFETFVAPFLPTRLTAPGSLRMGFTDTRYIGGAVRKGEYNEKPRS